MYAYEWVNICLHKKFLITGIFMMSNDFGKAKLQVVGVA